MNIKTKFTKLIIHQSDGTCSQCNISRKGPLLFVADDVNELLCATHAREKIESMISQFNYQISELRRLLDSFPKKVKNKSDDINITNHL